MISACGEVIFQNMGEWNRITNPSSDEEVAQKVDDSTHVFYDEQEYGELQKKDWRERVKNDPSEKITT